MIYHLNPCVSTTFARSDVHYSFQNYIPCTIHVWKPSVQIDFKQYKLTSIVFDIAHHMYTHNNRKFVGIAKDDTN